MSTGAPYARFYRRIIAEFVGVPSHTKRHKSTVETPTRFGTLHALIGNSSLNRTYAMNTQPTGQDSLTRFKLGVVLVLGRLLTEAVKHFERALHLGVQRIRGRVMGRSRRENQ